ncbi:MAG TPA: zf-HC2 domain-containing protein, partial [Pyrinomonadaceae bacterium]|nr:zf-HC2 domain-containing protein [Pyrinomonadaceae bacterium]
DLVTYLYGEASEADALDFRNHLRQCDSCRSEFTVFNQVHQSIETWRNEALGASFNPAPTPATVAIDSTPVIRHERRLSALAALREFFTVAPLWLRGATAFAALLFCVLGVMMIARLSDKPVATANNRKDEKMYTQQQVEAEVNKAVERKVAELSNNKDASMPIVATHDKPKSATSGVQVATSQQPKTLRPQRLTRQERQQLAADLRLTASVDEEELMAFPEQENPNQ